MINTVCVVPSKWSVLIAAAIAACGADVEHPPPPADADPAVCDLGTTTIDVQVYVDQDDPPQATGENMISGPCTVTKLDRLVVALDAGGNLLFSVWPVALNQFVVGQRLYVDAYMYMPFWRENEVVLRELVGDQPGEMLAAGWATSRDLSVTLPDVHLSYVSDTCAPVSPPNLCPTPIAVSRTLLVTLPASSGAGAMPAGSTGPIGPFDVGNGPSYYAGPNVPCTDQPHQWATGYVVRR